MTPEQIELVKSSWGKVAPAAEQVAELFYGRLFEIAPDSRALFTGDMKIQGRKLMAMLNTAVTSLDKLDTIVAAVQALAERHVDYGVEAKDYEPVGEALLWTLDQGLGDDFTLEVEQAWTLTYQTLAGVMIEAAATRKESELEYNSS